VVNLHSRKGNKANNKENLDLICVKDIVAYLEKNKNYKFEDLLKFNLPDLYLTPKFIVDFIREYILGLKIKSILDPYAGFCSLLMPLVKAKQIKNAKAYIQDFDHFFIAKYFLETNNIDIKNSDFSILSNEDSDKYDLVVGHLPFNSENIKFKKKFNEINIDLDDKVSNVLLIKSLLTLNEKGSAIFLVEPNFFQQRNIKLVYKYMKDLSLYIDSIISIPNGSLYPLTEKGGIIIIIHRGEFNKKVFLAELNQSRKNNSEIILNLKQKKEGTIPQLGVIIELDGFTNFKNILNQIDLEKAIDEMKLKEISFSDVVLEINNYKRNIENGFNIKSNSIYFPKFIDLETKVDFNELNSNYKDYIQIVVNPDIITAKELAILYNSHIGKRIKETLCKNTIIRKIDENLLMKSKIYKFKEDQIILYKETEHTISTYISLLETYQKDLAFNPNTVNKINKLVSAISTENSLENWIETLPYPLSYILRKYKTDLNIEHKVEYLLKFFQALLQYKSSLILSGYTNNRKFYSNEADKWLIHENKYQNWYKMSQFGGWRNFYNRLSSSLLNYLSNDHNEIILELFNEIEIDFLYMLSNKDFNSIYLELNNYRNDWHGHSGIASKSTYEKRLEVLEEMLFKIKQLISDHFAYIDLITPISSYLEKGVYYYTVYSFMGTKRPFQEISIKSLIELDNYFLYLLPKKSNNPIKFFPLIKLKRSNIEKEMGFYFYDRLEADNTIRFISYDLEDSDLNTEDRFVVNALNILDFNEYKNHLNQYFENK